MTVLLLEKNNKPNWDWISLQNKNYKQMNTSLNVIYFLNQPPLKLQPLHFLSVANNNSPKTI